MKRFNKDQNHKDPVCGMEVSPVSAVETSDFDHKTYYFCAAVCRQAFDAEPQKYIHHHRQHGVKPK